MIQAVGDQGELLTAIEGDDSSQAYREQAADPAISRSAGDLQLESTVVAPAYDGLLDLSYAVPIDDGRRPADAVRQHRGVSACVGHHHARAPGRASRKGSRETPGGLGDSVSCLLEGGHQDRHRRPLGRVLPGLPGLWSVTVPFGSVELLSGSTHGSKPAARTLFFAWPCCRPLHVGDLPRDRREKTVTALPGSTRRCWRPGRCGSTLVGRLVGVLLLPR